MRTKLALLAAVVLGFLAAIGVRSYITQRQLEIDKPYKRVSVVVARESINPGDLLREHMIKPFEAEVGMVTSSHILWTQRQSWLGQPLSQKVAVDEPILQGYFLGPDRAGDAPKKIDSGMRAVTIGTDQIAGVAGLIMPGHRVDVLGTFRKPGRGPDSAANMVTSVVARNVQVLATDSRTDLIFPVRGSRRAARFDRGYSSITLHVTALEASLLVFAQGTGKISFTLRNTEDEDTRDIPPISQTQFDELVHSAALERAQKAKLRKTPVVP